MRWTLVVLVCWSSRVSALLFPFVHPNQVYNYSPPEDDVTFHLYHRDDLSDSERLLIKNESSIYESRFDPEIPTKIIVHGWTHGKDVPWLVEMREAMANVGLWNVIVVDWSVLSHVIYLEARIHNLVVAKQLSKLLLLLARNTHVPMSSVHIIGHSMGAQIAAMASRRIMSTIAQKIGRITGLDPAAPLYEWPHIESMDELLDPSDATFVDVIHTNGRHFGMMTPAGHVDYYPNGGEIQEGCTFWVCSHLRACEFWTASIRKPDLFKAYSYKSWDEYLEGKRENFGAYPMGIAASPEIPYGIYFVEATDDYRKYLTSRTTLAHSRLFRII